MPVLAFLAGCSPAASGDAAPDSRPGTNTVAATGAEPATPDPAPPPAPAAVPPTEPAPPPRATRPDGRALPADVADFLARARQCASERPESAAEIWVAHERCMMMPEQQARLLRRYAREAEIAALIRSIDTSRY